MDGNGNGSIAVKSMTHDPAIFDDPRVIRNILQLDARYMPSETYFDDVQADVKPRMRKILLNWMLEVLEEQKCDHDIFFLAVNYIDRFLSATCISRDDLQLVGTAAMFVASKLREPKPLAADTLVMYTDNAVELRQLMMMEIMLVSTLKWDIAAITPFDVLVQILARLRIDASVRSRLHANAYAILTRFATSSEYLRYQSSMTAACALATAVELVHSDGESVSEESTFTSVACASTLSSHSQCIGCVQLGLKRNTSSCCYDELYDTLVQSVCDLLNMSKDQLSECRDELQNILFNEASEAEQHDDSPSTSSQQDDACSGDLDDVPPSLAQAEPHNSAVIHPDEDSLLSQADVEMAGLLEMNNNGIMYKLPNGKSLDDSGFASDLSPPTLRFASTPTARAGAQLLAT